MVEQLLLVLQVAFVVLLYLFIWRVVRVASRDLSVGQESMILTPVRPIEQVQRPFGSLVVTESPELEVGTRLEVSRDLIAGRDISSDVAVPADGYASARHARFHRGAEADMVEDLHSTNGTFVNGERLTGSQRLRPGDVITIGQTQLTYEGGS
ncbi:MAG TPA: FHA domain-containing protein [Gaiellales bacterium]|nr:FHA domain-containing protein [Gaiellales bacterium]